MSYVSTHLNRFYAALEPSYGAVPAVAADHAFRALALDLELSQEYLERRDKSGSRSFLGVISAGRRQARFRAEAYLMAGGGAGQAPDLAPLYQAACGGAPLAFAGGTAAAGCTATSIRFAAAHGLSAGQAIVSNGEMRFVTSVTSATEVVVSPGFSGAPASGSAITATASYPLAGSLPSVSLFDFWEPASAQQRILAGGAVDRLEIEVEGDFHMVRFSGAGQDLLDSITFTVGQGGLAAFPAEPSARNYSGEPIAGHFGQVWLGAAPARFSTLVRAALELENGLDLRADELGSQVPLGVAPGTRRVTFDFELYQTDDDDAGALYAAARNRTPVAALLQLGSSAGHIFGAYMKSLVPQAPRTDLRENEVRWSFTGSRAGGAGDDELWIAFG